MRAHLKEAYGNSKRQRPATAGRNNKNRKPAQRTKQVLKISKHLKNKDYENRRIRKQKSNN
ncbi:hypothetical protein BDD43_0061 [Mucilaginibacter gracilis]|uniref:Uncharacterized protein n=1 Tax=Mucilaginibacter gracilis TaxID=423350 RepID=A0A495IT71_9SPHI|nr:hypothetical protein BDD43_0061 [Mucilaginibacter gracilis]